MLQSTLELLELPSSTLAIVSGALAAGALYMATTPSDTKLAEDGETVARLAQRLPSTSWLLGDLPQYLKNSERVHQWMADESIALQGKPWRFVIPGQPTILMVLDPTLVDEVLQTKFHIFRRGQAMQEMLLPLFGNSLINSDGARWHHQRKAAAKFFTAKSLRMSMTTTMLKNMGQVNDVIDSSIANGSTVELSALFHAFTMQTFAEVGLGIDLKWIGQPERNPLEKHIDVANFVTLQRFRIPAFVWRTQQALRVGAQRQLLDSMEEVRSWIRAVVKESLEATTTERERSDVKSVIELFVEHSNDGVEGMGPDDLVDFILTFMLAAQDTSAVSLSWFFLLTIKHPHVARKIREEMASVLPSIGVTDTDTYLTTDHVQNLVYLEATIKEVLRLYPAVPMMQRQCMEDEVIGGNIFVPKGTLVGFSPYVMARLAQVWGPDAAEFKPERWIDPSTGELIPVPSNKLIGFSHGPRVCIGMKLAMLELRIVTANLMHRYDFELAAPNSCDYAAALTLVLKDPLVVRAKRL